MRKGIIRSIATSSLIGLGLALWGRTTWTNSHQDKHSDDTSSTQIHPYGEIDAYVQQRMKDLNIKGATLAIVEGIQIVHMKGFGVSGPQCGTPTPQAPFFIGSLTKSITALATMQLVEAGKIELDAPVQRYLPWFTLADTQAAAQITVRHLLIQTSGLSQPVGMRALADLDCGNGASERQARALAALKLSRPVGSAWEYSNMNYNLLGLIIEAVTGGTYADYLRSHVFPPLDMNHTFTSKSEAKKNGLGSGYISWFGIPIAVPDLPVPRGSLASGQLISSAEDMAHYLIAQLNGGRYHDAQILGHDGIAEMQRPAVRAAVMGISAGHYGMGWFISGTGPNERVWHNGQVPDYFAYMALLPERNRGFVLLINTNQMFLNFALEGVGAGVASLLNGDHPHPFPWAAIPWLLRAPLLLPLIQIVGVVTTLRAVRRWRQAPNEIPDPARLGTLHIALPILLNLIPVSGALGLLATRMSRFTRLFAPDLYWLTIFSGGSALVWIGTRTTLILRTVRKTTCHKRVSWFHR